MRIYLCFWRRGGKENPEKDFEYITTSRRVYDQWFARAARLGDPQFRAYGHEINYRTQPFLPGQVQDYVYRGGPGV